MAQEEFVRFKCDQFSARFPKRFLYTRTHFWLWEESVGVWRIGLTSVATRMLGEIVEFDFKVAQEGQIQLGQAIGWIEGFKAISDIHSVAEGKFAGGNPMTAENFGLVGSDPYGKGWLYQIQGAPEPQAMDVNGYIEYLNLMMQRMSGDNELE